MTIDPAQELGQLQQELKRLNAELTLARAHISGFRTALSTLRLQMQDTNAAIVDVHERINALIVATTEDADGR